MVVRLRSRRGIGLYDAMIAVFLLAAAGAIFGAAFPAGFRSIRQAGDSSKATAIAQAKIEQIRSLRYESLNYACMRAANMIDTSPLVSPYSFTAVDSLATQIKDGAGTIQITDDSPTIKRVVVTVTYSGSSGTNREVVLTTLVSDKRMAYKTGV
jgi:hypothetical protein